MLSEHGCPIAPWTYYAFKTRPTSARGIRDAELYTSIAYTDRLAAAGALASIGSVGDSYDNAMAESIIGLFKTELVRWEGPWRGLGDLELAVLGWVDWYNHTRLYEALEYRTPAAVEAEYYRSIQTPDEQPLAGQLTAH